MEGEEWGTRLWRALYVIFTSFDFILCTVYIACWHEWVLSRGKEDKTWFLKVYMWEDGGEHGGK